MKYCVLILVVGFVVAGGFPMDVSTFREGDSSRAGIKEPVMPDGLDSKSDISHVLRIPQALAKHNQKSVDRKRRSPQRIQNDSLSRLTPAPINFGNINRQPDPNNYMNANIHGTPSGGTSVYGDTQRNVYRSPDGNTALYLQGQYSREFNAPQVQPANVGGGVKFTHRF